jgi:hypothetical protein
MRYVRGEGLRTRCRGVDVDRVDKIPDWEVRFAWRVDTCGGALLQVPQFLDDMQ